MGVWIVTEIDFDRRDLNGVAKFHSIEEAQDFVKECVKEHLDDDTLDENRCRVGYDSANLIETDLWWFIDEV